MLKCFFTLACAILLCIVAPSSVSASGDKDRPIWIKMMDDPNVNYYKAIEEYKSFWKNKEKPEDEAEMHEKHTPPGEKHVKKQSKREVKESIKEKLEEDYYRYECKRFENWVRVNKPYVQKDGHILTTEERLNIWQQTQTGK